MIVGTVLVFIIFIQNTESIQPSEAFIQGQGAAMIYLISSQSLAFDFIAIVVCQVITKIMMSADNYYMLEGIHIVLINSLFKYVQYMTERKAFFEKKKQEQWNESMDNLFSNSIIITKYDPVTSKVQLHNCNHQARKFGIDNEDFLERIKEFKIDLRHSKMSVKMLPERCSLKDYLLQKHYFCSSMSQEQIIKQNLGVSNKESQEPNFSTKMKEKNQFTVPGKNGQNGINSNCNVNKIDTLNLIYEGIKQGGKKKMFKVNVGVLVFEEPFIILSMQDISSQSEFYTLKKQSSVTDVIYLRGLNEIRQKIVKMLNGFNIDRWRRKYTEDTQTYQIPTEQQLKFDQEDPQFNYQSKLGSPRGQNYNQGGRKVSLLNTHNTISCVHNSPIVFPLNKQEPLNLKKVGDEQSLFTNQQTEGLLTDTHLINQDRNIHSIGQFDQQDVFTSQAQLITPKQSKKKTLYLSEPQSNMHLITTNRAYLNNEIEDLSEIGSPTEMQLTSPRNFRKLSNALLMKSQNNISYDGESQYLQLDNNLNQENKQQLILLKQGLTFILNNTYSLLDYIILANNQAQFKKLTTNPKILSIKKLEQQLKEIFPTLQVVFSDASIKDKEISTDIRRLKYILLSVISSFITKKNSNITNKNINVDYLKSPYLSNFNQYGFSKNNYSKEEQSNSEKQRDNTLSKEPTFKESERLQNQDSFSENVQKRQSMNSEQTFQQQQQILSQIHHKDQDRNSTKDQPYQSKQLLSSLKEDSQSLSMSSSEQEIQEDQCHLEAKSKDNVSNSNSNNTHIHFSQNYKTLQINLFPGILGTSSQMNSNHKNMNNNNNNSNNVKIPIQQLDNNQNEQITISKEKKRSKSIGSLRHNTQFNIINHIDTLKFRGNVTFFQDNIQNNNLSTTNPPHIHSQSIQQTSSRPIQQNLTIQQNPQIVVSSHNVDKFFSSKQSSPREGSNSNTFNPINSINPNTCQQNNEIKSNYDTILLISMRQQQLYNSIVFTILSSDSQKPLILNNKQDSYPYKVDQQTFFENAKSLCFNSNSDNFIRKMEMKNILMNIMCIGPIIPRIDNALNTFTFEIFENVDILQQATHIDNNISNQSYIQPTPHQNKSINQSPKFENVISLNKLKNGDISRSPTLPISQQLNFALFKSDQIVISSPLNTQNTRIKQRSFSTPKFNEKFQKKALKLKYKSKFLDQDNAQSQVLQGPHQKRYSFDQQKKFAFEEIKSRLNDDDNDEYENNQEEEISEEEGENDEQDIATITSNEINYQLNEHNNSDKIQNLPKFTNKIKF